MSPNISKRDGRIESFSREKLERSITAAGASAETSRKIAESMEIRDGMSSNDIRKTVLGQLRQMDSRYANTYERQRRLNIRKMDEVKIGTIQIDRNTMIDMHLRPGDPLEIVLGTSTETLSAEMSNGSGLDAYLNNDDIRSLSLKEGSRVLVRSSRRE